MAKRPLIVRIGWTLRDYAKRVWDNAGEDSVFFLAGGIAFNLILAALPFVLLLGTGLTYFLPMFVPGDVDSNQKIFDFIDHLLPAHAETGPNSPYHTLINDLLRTRRA